MSKKLKILISIIIFLLIIGLAVYFIFINKNKNIEEISTVSTDNSFISKLTESCTNAEYEIILALTADKEIQEELEGEVVENTDVTTNKNNNKKAVKEIPYYIKVNYTQNVVTIYGKDENGNYTKPIKAMLCSTGSATPTSGTYSISSKYTWLPLFGGVYGQYSTRIVGHILFHSVPYQIKGDKGSLEYWEYDKLGTSASAGCIRLTVQDAKWIYNNCTSGTKVEFYADSNPGPLGKPTAQKISSEVAVRDWDPTDPDSNNPWKTYKKENTQNNNTNNSVTNIVNPGSTNNMINNNINNTINNTNNVNTINNDKNNTISNTVNNNINNTINNNVTNNIINNIINNTVKNNINNNNINKNNTLNNVNSNVINNTNKNQ